MARFAGIILLLTMIFSPADAGTLRVVSLYPGHSDNIAAMGGGEFLVALSENDDDDLLPELPRVPLRSGAERILSMRPDVIITRPFAERASPNLYDVLRRSGVKVVSIDPPSWDDFPEYLRKLAETLNLDAESAISRLNSIRDEISRNAKTSNRPRVFLEATSRELHTCSPDSWAARLIELSGGVNIASDAVPLRKGSAIASWGVERVIKNAESLDIYIIQTGAMNTSTAESFRAREWAGALRNVKVCEIPERYISRPSLLGLERGGRELLRIFSGEGSENAR